MGLRRKTACWRSLWEVGWLINCIVIALCSLHSWEISMGELDLEKLFEIPCSSVEQGEVEEVVINQKLAFRDSESCWWGVFCYCVENLICDNFEITST